MGPKSRREFTIAIICALPLEADAVEALFDVTYDKLGAVYGKQHGDANLYTTGRIGRHDVVLCCMPRIGKVSAAAVASSLQISYTGIQLALVVGVCGGVPFPSHGSEIVLGDIIISDTVVEYDVGKQYPDGFQRRGGLQVISGGPNKEIRTLLTALRTRNGLGDFQDRVSLHLRTLQQLDPGWQSPGVEYDVLYEPSYQHKHHHTHRRYSECLCSDSANSCTISICPQALLQDCGNLGCHIDRISRYRNATETTAKLSVHIGAVASADTVMKSGEHRDRLAKLDGVIGFEMEGAGVWDNLPCIIVKGVCDYADSHKNKDWQAYAAAAGAAGAKTLLEYWQRTKKNDAHWMVPFQRNPHFVGRQNEINQLENLILTPDLPSKIAITGLGGVGKTQIALDLAYRIQEKGEFSIFWVPSTSIEIAEQAYIQILQLLGMKNVKPSQAKERLKYYLSVEHVGNWLLIIDNADDMDMWIRGGRTSPALKEFLPENPCGRVLFTTRNRKLAVKLASSSHVIHIPELDQGTAVKVLERSLIQRTLLDGNITSASALLEELAFLPLAITQAAAYINENGIGLDDYRKLLREQESDVIELLSQEDTGCCTSSVATTWLVSFQQIQKLDQLAAEYLFMMACINPQNIPQSLLPEATPKRKTDALGLLNAYSFISTPAGGRSLNLHRLVHIATRNWMREQGLFTMFICKTAQRFDKTFPEHHNTDKTLWQEYLPHILSLIGENDFHQEYHINLLQRVQISLYKDGRYKEAERLIEDTIQLLQQIQDEGQNPIILSAFAFLALIYLRQGRLEEAEKLSLQVMEKDLSEPDDPHLLFLMGHLAGVYKDLGRVKEANELAMKVFDTHKRLRGPEHADTAYAMNILVSTYLGMGQWKKAEELAVEAVKLQSRVFGPEHPDTLAALDNLALAHMNQGQVQEAEKLFVHIRDIFLRIRGPDHPDTLVIAANLVFILIDQTRFAEAEEQGRRVMDARLRVLSADHPHTLASMEAMAQIYRLQGRLTEAEQIGLQLLESWKRGRGLNNPSALASMANLALTYLNQGRFLELEQLSLQVMTTGKRVLGAEHPQVLKALDNLVLAHRGQGRWMKAEELGLRVVESWTRVFGPDHPDTLNSTCNLALIYMDQGRWEEAERLNIQVAGKSKRELGPGHPQTLMAMNSLALIYRAQRRMKEAEDLGHQLVRAWAQYSGPDSLSAIASMANLALGYMDQNRWNAAESLNGQLVEKWKRLMGPSPTHPNALMSMANLASTYANQGRWEEAEKLEKYVMETRSQMFGPEHPDTVASMHNLAYTWKSIGRDDDALLLMTKCVHLRNQNLGPSHPHAQASSEFLAAWQGRGASSRKHSRKSTSDQRESSTPSHTFESGYRRGRALFRFFRRE